VHVLFDLLLELRLEPYWTPRRLSYASRAAHHNVDINHRLAIVWLFKVIWMHYANLMTKDEARRIAANIFKLLELLVAGTAANKKPQPVAGSG
jgi:hypothetical protein